MRTIQVSLRFDSPGGVETTVRELSRRLRSVGDDVEVYASDLVDEARWARSDRFQPTVDGVPVRRFAAVRRSFLPRYSLPVMSGLIDALSESGAHVIHAHSHRYGHVLQAAAVSSRCRIPLVVSTHYHPADRQEPPMKRAFLRAEDFLFGASAYRIAKALIVESELERALVREFAPADRIHVIPPGIDLEDWSHREKDGAPGPGLPERYLLFVGRIASNKGLRVLLQALARLPRGPDRPALVVMGVDWGEQAALEGEARRLGLADALRWLGHVSDRGVYRAVIRGANALVLPSEWEAFGLVLLEAMAAGTLIVATSVGGVPELLEGGRSGRLVPYGDATALAEALVSVTGDPGTTALLVERGSLRVQQFDWSVCVERHRELYRSVSGSSPE